MSSRRFEPNYYAGSYLDRLAHLRQDEAQLAALLGDPGALIVPVWQARNLVTLAGGHPSAVLLQHDQQIFTGVDDSQLILLGHFREGVCFALQLEGTEPPVLSEGFEFQDLRTIGADIDRQEAGLLAYARAMVLWRERHRFCGRCGAPNRGIHGGHVMECTNPSCSTRQFPRLDPAVIVLVTDGERALLGRQASWPPGRYSTIAGYVEPGESLEDAVIREVREETGIETDEVDYHSSQPWPFPSSLMLGFMAHAASTDIHQSDDELEDVRWFTRAQIATGEITLPPSQAISYRLIEHWYDAGSTTPLRAEAGVRIAGFGRR